MAKNKATHQGTCQICGATQKLPAGVLSLHGYTTKWGFFSGTCSGSGHLPFEQSKDLIEAVIARTETDIQVTTQLSDVLKAGNLDADGTCYKYVSANGVSCWQKVTIEPTEVPSRFRYRAGAISQTFFLMTYGIRPDADIDGIRRHFNHNYAERFLDSRCNDMRAYISWQRQRTASWKPAELKAI